MPTLDETIPLEKWLRQEMDRCVVEAYNQGATDAIGRVVATLQTPRLRARMALYRPEIAALLSTALIGVTTHSPVATDCKQDVIHLQALYELCGRMIDGSGTVGAPVDLNAVRQILREFGEPMVVPAGARPDAELIDYRHALAKLSREMGWQESRARLNV